MVDIGLIRQNPDLFRDSLKRRGGNVAMVDELVAIDELWRKTTQKLELLQSQSNGLSKSKESATEHKDQLVKLKKEIAEAKAKVADVQSKLEAKLLAVPNLLLEEVPTGDASNNKVITQKGKTSGKGLAHEETLTQNGQLNLETAAEFSGSRFRYLIGQAAIAQRQLMNSAIKFAVENGYELVIPPVVAKKSLMDAAGFFPAGEDDTFSLGNDQYLVGTSEPLLLALAANKKYRKADLPKRYVGFSTCFRKEAGSYGKDVRGMFRVHQFDKVEMVSITTPEQSAEEHERLISLQQKFVEQFNIPYQTVLLAAGDQSQIAAKQVDLECWFPSQGRYRETHSASNCIDYQSRALKIKCDSDSSPLAHTLNATLATERLLLAIVENNTDQDGKINWPKELVS